MHFWVAVATIAGVLGRKVWIEQHSFRWYPNHYIFLVGPPDVVSKSTTVKLGMNLLKAVPNFQMGPTTASWQGLVKEMADNMECDYDLLGNGQITKLCQCMVASSELGNFLKPKDGEFLDTMIALWDGDTIDKKLIKDGGSLYIENPILNLIGCTTPSWITLNIPEHMLEGGLLSRVIMVYADQIDHPVAYPGDSIPKNIAAVEANLIDRLTAMDKIKGPMYLTPEAKAWGTEWYNKMKTEGVSGDEKQRDRITRRQTHVHKLAMVLAISRGESKRIDVCDLQRAVGEIDKLSAHRQTIVAAVGRTQDAATADHILAAIAKGGKSGVKMAEAYRAVREQVPSGMVFRDLLDGLVKSGMVKEQVLGGISTFFYVG